jgi:hypothetical protein
VLKSVDSSDDKLLLKFSFVKLVETPLKPDLQKSLQELLGQKICIINIDGEYFIRKLSK